MELEQLAQQFGKKLSLVDPAGVPVQALYGLYEKPFSTGKHYWLGETELCPSQNTAAMKLPPSRYEGFGPFKCSVSVPYFSDFHE
jgi:hypothetical protein